MNTNDTCYVRADLVVKSLPQNIYCIATILLTC